MISLGYQKVSTERWRVASDSTVTCGDSLTDGDTPQVAARSGTVTILNDRLELSCEETSPAEPPWLPLETTDPATLLARFRAAGIVGHGGAGFPVWRKLLAAARAQVSTLIINAVECEPGIQCDATLANAAGYTEVRRAVGAIEELLPGLRTVIVHSDRVVLDPNWPHLDRYDVGSATTPAGAEGRLITQVFGRPLNQGQRPIDIGAVVLNLGTMHALGRAVAGWPQTDRYVTVDQETRWLPIGTPVARLIPGDTHWAGGFLSGRNRPTQDAVLKGNTNALHPPREAKAEWPCIRCGACDAACPEHLPVVQLYGTTDVDQLHRLGADRCLECGLCEPVCPSQISLTSIMRERRCQVVGSLDSASDRADAKARYEQHLERATARAAAEANRRAQRLSRRRRA